MPDIKNDIKGATPGASPLIRLFELYDAKNEARTERAVAQVKLASGNYPADNVSAVAASINKATERILSLDAEIQAVKELFRDGA